MQYSGLINNKQTPQTEAIFGETQVKNNAGGYVYQVDCWTQFTRFLILGSEGGTYYVGEKKLTVENAANAIKCIKEDGVRAVKLITDISINTRAPKNDQAIFALALVKAYGDANAKAAMYSAIPQVCRIGTHVFQFCQSVQDIASWSGGLRRAVGRCYTNLPLGKLELQVVKYRQRNGWTHRDVMRLAHPKAKNEDQNKVFKYAVGKMEDPQTLGGMIAAYERLSRPDVTVKEIVNAVMEYHLPWEAIPTHMLSDLKVWDALLPHMGYTATLRNLAKLTSIGMLKTNLDAATKLVCERLASPEKERVHPMAILLAMKTYSSGHGFKGSLSWTPVTKVVDTLNDAFYSAFKNVEPTNKDLVLALDVSGSMYGNMIAGTNLDAGTCAAAMALITANVEKGYEILAFQTRMVPLDISPKMRLDDVVRKMSRLPFAGTDCSLPMLWAIQNKIQNIGAFCIYTDSETWAGNIHPSQALREYRKNFAADAKLCVVGMTATEFSIADKNDRGMMDCVGFDTATPNIMSEFIKGNV